MNWNKFKQLKYVDLKLSSQLKKTILRLEHTVWTICSIESRFDSYIQERNEVIVEFDDESKIIDFYEKIRKKKKLFAIEI